MAGAERSEWVTAQARRWLLRHQRGDMDPREQQAFERWQRQAGAHRREYARLSALWRELDLIADDMLAEFSDGPPPVSRQPAPAPLSRWRSTGWIAASLLVAIALFGAYRQFASPTIESVSEQYSSAKRELRTIVLDDGSTLQLGSYSRANIAFDTRQRLVYLHSGEAYFQVADEPRRPFIVQTHHGRSTALGTEFEVRVGVGQVRVTVHEGVVEVAARGRAQRLSTSHVRVGEQVSYSDNGRLSAIRDVDLALSAGWRSGNMVFDQQPLVEVVSELNRYSRKPIVIGDPRLKAIKVNGVFRSGAIDAVLGAIDASLPAQLEYGDDRITLRYQPSAGG